MNTVVVTVAIAALAGMVIIGCSLGPEKTEPPDAAVQAVVSVVPTAQAFTTAPFRITESGAVVATSGPITAEAVSVETVIQVKDIPGRQPEFERRYEVRVGDGFVVKIMLWTTMSSSRLARSTLTQRNGKYISFDADAVADKIIDRELYPLVQAAVDRILKMDREFIASRPSEFVDDTGARWVRQGGS